MPWKPSYSDAEARAAIAGAESWRASLQALGLGYHGKNIDTLRRWARRWGIPTDHLPEGGGGRRLEYGDADLRVAVANSRSWAEALRRLGYCPSGGNWKTLKKRTAALGVSTDHFDPYATSRERSRRSRTPLEEILVARSTFSRTCLKQRLYDEGVKETKCELCGQDDNWCGKRMGLILDHANGVRDDNRLENLRIICPNCAATLETHCGRKNREPLSPRACLRCDRSFVPKYPAQRYCSSECGSRWDRRGVKHPGARKVERPPHQQLLHEVDRFGYRAVGRKYGVSDNAIRKWLRQYEREQLLAAGRDPSVVEIPKRTWPNRRREEDDVAA
ncbi:MAG: hypothetical protein ACRDL0_14125 [Thermoleophilaceae bacterium]